MSQTSEGGHGFCWTAFLLESSGDVACRQMYQGSKMKKAIFAMRVRFSQQETGQVCWFLGCNNAAQVGFGERHCYFYHENLTFRMQTLKKKSDR